MQRTLFFLLCWVPLALADDSWENFTNNLATDLAPLITLFGERLTKQFLSESTSLLDNVIFALSPLGVLTAVVSLIRVCGGSSLRAFIGRAQEGPAEAESELLSCVSESTAELFNDGGISRVFGRPKVLEIIAWKDVNAGTGETSIEIGTLRDALMKGAWRNVKNGARSQISLEGFPELDMPNLSLNKGIKRRDQFWFYCAAVIGTVLQIGDIIYAALTVFVFPQTFKKDGQLVPNYAFPFYITGTSLMFLGMFYSAFIIERSSKEYRFEPNLPSKIYWLQPGNQNVGDQVFNSFLAVKDGPGFSKKKKMQYIKSKRVRKYDGRHIKIHTAVLSTISGFVIQFIGLRGLHASVILAQLGSTFVMSIIRTCLRTERMAPDENRMGKERDIVSHRQQELDCFAFHLERVESFSLINTPCPQASRTDLGKMPSDELKHRKKPLVEQLIYTRTRLAELTSTRQYGQSLAWDNLPVRVMAQRLAEAINSTMNLLSSWESKFPDGFQFELAFECQQASPHPFQGSYTIELVPNRDRLKWNVNARELEAIIGLWTWSLYKSDPNWLRPRTSQPLSRVIGLSEIEAGKEETFLYFHKWMYRETEPRMIPAKSVDIQHRLFGYNTEEHPDERCILTVDTQNELEVMTAQDIYIQFLRSAIEHLISVDTDVHVVPGPQGTFVAQNSRVNDLLDCFENCSLGSREDALLCIIPVLKHRNMLPVLPADYPTIRERVEDLIEQNDWRRALQLLEWICQRSEGGERDYAMLELGNVCRRALLTSNQAGREAGLEYLNKILGQDMRADFLRTQSTKFPSTWSAPAGYERGWQKIRNDLRWVVWQIALRETGQSPLRTCLEKTKNFNKKCDFEEPGVVEEDQQYLAMGSHLISQWLAVNRTDVPVHEFANQDINGYRWVFKRKNITLMYFLILTWAEMGAENPQLIRQAYFVAAKNRSDTGMYVLRRRRDDIKAKNAALMDLIATGDIEAVRVLLTNGADPGAEFIMPLIEAARFGFTDMAALLLQYGAKLEGSDDLGMSALNWASKQNHLDTVRLLASHGANLDRDSDWRLSQGAGWKPLHSAVEGNQFQMVKLLLELGADINMPERQSKQTALMLAARSPDTAILRLLLFKNANLHAKDAKGRSALLWAKIAGSAEAVAILEASSRRTDSSHRKL